MTKRLITLQRRKGTREWTPERMMGIAKARDNGGPWFLAKSRRTVRDLERLFRQREVAGLLEECVGGIVGGFGLIPQGIIKIQIAYEQPEVFQDVLLCLNEIEIEVIGPVTQNRELEVPIT